MSLRTWSAGYCTAKKVDPPSKESAARTGLGAGEMIASRIFTSRKYQEAHTISQDPKDLATDDQRDPRPKLYGLRAVLSDCLAIPKRDREGLIRTWVGRRVHPQPVTEIAGDYAEGEALPLPSMQDNPKYLYLPKVRRDAGQGESTVREEEFYPLLLSPSLISAEKEHQKKPIWICEGVIDALVASQAGAASIGMDGAYGYAAKIEELVRVLAGPSKSHRPIYLCYDLDPERQDAGKQISMGPGQRGTCALLADLWRRSPGLARSIKVAPPLRGPGTTGKIDLGDLLAAAAATVPVPDDVDIDHGIRTDYERAVHTAQAARLQEIAEGALDPWVFMIDQIPANVPVRDRRHALAETGLDVVAAKDPDLWAEVAPQVAERLGIPPKEVKSWAKSVAKGVKAEAHASSAADPLERYTRQDGTVVATYESTKLLVARECQTIQWDEMALRVMVGGKRLDRGEFGDLRSLLAQKYGCDVRRCDLEDAIGDLAVRDSFHPIRTWLRGLPAWDGKDRISDLLDTLGISSARGYSASQIRLYSTYIRKTLIAAVVRALEPGCQVDTMLVFQGDQGIRKSTFFRSLAPVEEWFGDAGRLDPEAKDSIMLLRKKWILEVAEVDKKNFFRNESEWKDLITTRVDSIRAPYMKEIEEYPRSSIFVGTTNAEQFLTDPTGHRRFWVVQLNLKKLSGEEIDAEKIIVMRGQIWAQAVASFTAWVSRGRKKEECCWWLDREEEELHSQDIKRHTVDDLETNRISAWLDAQSSKTVTGIQIAAALGIERPSPGDGRRFSRHMQALGWRPKHTKGGTVYCAPEDWTPGSGLRLLDGGAAPGASLSLEDLLD